MRIKEEILQSVTNYSKLNPLCDEVHLMIAKNSPDLKEIEEKISSKPNCYKNLIKIINAACYGMPQKVTNLKDGFDLLGKEIISYMMTICSLQEILTQPVPGYDLKEKELWNHLLISGILSQQLSIICKLRVDPFIAFLSGFLSDTGKIVMGPFIQKYKSRIIAGLEDSDESFEKLEKRIFEINHSEISKILAFKWGFPQIIQDAVLMHHQPDEVKDFALSSLSHVATNLSILRGNGLSYEGLNYFQDQKIIEKLNLNIDQIELTYAETYPIIEELIHH